MFTFLWASEHFSVDSSSFWLSVEDKAMWVNGIIKKKKRIFHVVWIFPLPVERRDRLRMKKNMCTVDRMKENQ